VVSLGIAATVIYGTWDLLKDSVSLAIQSVPPGINTSEVRNYLAQVP
jgi:cobalt-zinc-cadmium efflux system protein